MWLVGVAAENRASPTSMHTNGARAMNAIKKVRMYMQKNPKSREAKVLGRLAAALAEEQTFPLAELYSLDLDAFELALELMADWRLDRYYSARLKLLDTILAEVAPELAGDDAPAPPAS